MVRLRYFLVHRYEHIDPDVLANMVNQYIGGFVRFRDEILAYLEARHLDLSGFRRPDRSDPLMPVWETTPDVVAAWAFGSAQDGQLRDGSDVDVGVLMARPPTFDEQLDLLDRLQAALGLDEVDLVVLNEAHAILRFKAVSGRRLFTRDLPALAEFVSLTAREYEDAMALVERDLRWRAELNAARARPAETAQRP